MHANRYEGIVSSEVAQLIVKRAKRHRVSADEIDDLQQQIVPLLAEFKFDPARANGATPTTAMTALIDHQIQAHQRAKRRYRQRLERLHARAGEPIRDDSPVPGQVAQPEPVDLRIDLERTMEQLSPRDREICQALAGGHNVSEIAEQLGIGRDTVDRAIVRIRKAFEAAGLKAWIDPNWSNTKNSRGREE